MWIHQKHEKKLAGKKTWHNSDPPLNWQRFSIIWRQLDTIVYPHTNQNLTLSCFPICVICYSLATTRIFSRTTEEQGGTNLRVESFHFCFSVRFLNSFFLLKLFPGMCCLFFLTHHPHFSQTTGEQGRTNWRVESFDTFSVSFVDSFFLLNLFSCMRYLLLLAYYPQFSLISDYLSLTTVYLPLPKYVLISHYLVPFSFFLSHWLTIVYDSLLTA